MALFADLNDIPDPIYVAEGTYHVTVEKAEVKEDKSGNPYYQFVLTIDEEPEAEPIFHTMFPPREDQEPRLQMLSLRKARAFATAFGLDLGGFDIDDCLGRTASAVVKTKSRSKDDPSLEHYVAQWA